MKSAYELFHKQAATNIQLYTVLRFATQCDNATALTMDTYESASVFLAAKCSVSRVFSIAPIKDEVQDVYNKIAKELNLNFKIEPLTADNFKETDLLYINTPAEGNYRAMELGKYAEKVCKFILMPKTVEFAHRASPQIKLNEDMTPIGMVFGINHFLQAHDNWFILEHDDIAPGMTVLVNRNNVKC